MRLFALALVFSTGCATTRANLQNRTADEVLAAAPASDWREIAADELLVVDSARGRVVIALAPEMAPRTIANVKALAHAGFYDGLAFIRAQDDYVAQWGDPDESREIVGAEKTVKAEFDRDAAGLAFDVLPDADTYAAEVGYVRGFPAAREGGRAWLTHCYGMVGIGRDEDADSGAGTDLYMVIGHAPRHLDRNVTVIGRVVDGMPILATLPRGREKMGFYGSPEERTPITRVRLASELVESDRPRYRTLRSDSASFVDLLEARRNRRDPWTKRPAGHIDVCNAPNATQPITGTTE